MQRSTNEQFHNPYHGRGYLPRVGDTVEVLPRTGPPTKTATVVEVDNLEGDETDETDTDVNLVEYTIETAGDERCTFTMWKAVALNGPTPHTCHDCGRTLSTHGVRAETSEGALCDQCYGGDT